MMVRSRELASVDLNLLLVFAAVDEHRHITRAAKTLGLTQPALSHALSRLRNLFADPLFVKTSKGMVPTPKAEKLSTPIRGLLKTLVNDVLAMDTEFRPEKLKRVFNLQSTDLMEALLFPKLLKDLAAEAPEVQVSGRSSAFSFPQIELETGKTDLAIAGFYGELPDGFYQRKLYSDVFACAVRKSHPRLGKIRKATLSQYLGEKHLLVAPGGELSGKIDLELRKTKQTRFIAAGMQTFLGSTWMLGESDCVLTGPMKLLTLASEKIPLHTFPCPIELAPIHITQVWHARNHADPAHQWFRNKVAKILS